jgi:GNAT superfamily N-acetyltransferase
MVATRTEEKALSSPSNIADPITTVSPRGPRVREATADDAEACAGIFWGAFATLASRHSFPIEPGSPEFSRFTIDRMLATDGITGLVAERDGRVIGSAFVDERGIIAGVGPVSVDPDAQDAGVGRALMQAVLDRQQRRMAAGVRLVQTAYHYRSLGLYAKLGFRVRETLSVLQGELPALRFAGIATRPATDADLAACGELCEQIHGHDRNAELAEAIRTGTAHVSERPNRISGYATGFGYGWHAVAETNEDMRALLTGAETLMGLGVLVPSRNAELLRWCLHNGLRIVQQSTLMTIGLYSEPAGPYLPSIVF